MDSLKPPDDFDFPFVPYDIQKLFMTNLYEAIESKKIGIFESPTGTGKSMSIICGALTWLRDNDNRVRAQLEKILATPNEDMKTITSDEKENKSSAMNEDPAWITEFVQRQETKTDEKNAQTLSKKLQTRDKRMKRIRDGIERESSDERCKKRMKFGKRKTEIEDETTRLLQQAKQELELHDKKQSGNSIDEDDPEIILQEYQSDDEGDLKGFEADEEEDDDDNGLQKIYYCSRTHSQLTQFIREIQKSPFGQLSKEDESNFQITVVPLASRQSMCINEAVRRLPSLQQVNDRCLDMQKNVKKKENEDEEEETGKKHIKNQKSSATCSFFKAHSHVEDLSERILGEIKDIEEIVKAGKELEGCPYYATRHAVPHAQLIVVPYQTLLHNGTRQASGIKLKDSIIIVDEAHNLVDTISNIHSVQITCSQVSRAHNQLTQYSQKFRNRLKAKNLMYVKQILFILQNLLSIMGIQDKQFNPSQTKGAAQLINVKHCSKSDEVKTTLMTIHNFLFNTNMDNINLYKVLRYCERSMISRKLNGFVEKYEGSDQISTNEVSNLSKFLQRAKKAPENNLEPPTVGAATIMRSPLMHIESFLSSLTSANEDGRVAVTTMSVPGDQSKIQELTSIKFLLLNPAAHFTQVINECRSLIVAGGTMQPSSSFVNQLLLPAGIPTSRVFEFSCGHVIGNDQLLPIVIGNGPSGAEFEFTFEKRRNPKLIDELGRMLCNLCNIIPGGVICFFPSYDYEKMVHSRWKETDILTRIEMKKKIFREPKKTSQVDQVLCEYSTCIKRSKSGNNAVTGALLLSVVGGKMSEGINFSDDLGRCVIMVGLPYPNLYSAELKEKMSYLDSHMPRVGTKSAGQSYYENLCMKAVNQSIGRAIRHRNDHACIVLADKRYARSNISSQLPGWIADKLQIAEKFGLAFGAVRKFFVSKKSPD